MDWFTLPLPPKQVRWTVENTPGQGGSWSLCQRKTISSKGRCTKPSLSSLVDGPDGPPTNGAWRNPLFQNFQQRLNGPIDYPIGTPVASYLRSLDLSWFSILLTGPERPPTSPRPMANPSLRVLPASSPRPKPFPSKRRWTHSTQRSKPSDETPPKELLIGHPKSQIPADWRVLFAACSCLS